MSAAESMWLGFWETFGTLGFILVIVGVVIEGVGHFVKFKRAETARRLRIEKIGWLILVAGLAMEFLGEKRTKRISDRENRRLTTVAEEARERSLGLESTNLILRANVAQLEVLMAQAKSNIFRADPRKQPIATASATVELHVRRTNIVNWTGTRDKTIFGISRLNWGKFSQITMTNLSKVHLIADDFDCFGNDSANSFFINFHMPARGGVMNAIGDSVEAADEWDALYFDAHFLPMNAEIGGGTATVILNGFFVKQFKIPPQQPVLPVVTARIQDGQVLPFSVGQGLNGGTAIDQ